MLKSHVKGVKNGYPLAIEVNRFGVVINGGIQAIILRGSLQVTLVNTFMNSDCHKSAHVRNCNPAVYIGLFGERKANWRPHLKRG